MNARKLLPLRQRKASILARVTARAILTLLLTAALLPAGLLTAQERPETTRNASRPLPGNVVNVTAGEFYFQAPDTIRAGLTTFQLRQMGLIHRRVLAGGAARDSGVAEHADPTRGFHMLWIVRLDSGRTAADFHRAAQAGETEKVGRNLGGPGFAVPPRTTNATLTLAPGNYVLACFIGSAREDRSRYHLLNGMFKAITVVPAASTPAAAPQPDIVMRVTADGAVGLSAPVTAGRQLIRVENGRVKAYEFQIRRVLPGHTTAEVLAWRLGDNPGTPMPFEPWGGLSDVPAGGSLLTTMTFEPGDYLVGRRVAFTVLPARR